jgi:hypothetical protein
MFGLCEVLLNIIESGRIRIKRFFGIIKLWLQYF